MALGSNYYVDFRFAVSLVGLSNWDKLAPIMPAVSQRSEDDSLFSHDFLKYRGLSNWYHLTKVSDEETEAIKMTTVQLHPLDVLLRDDKASVTFHLSEVTAIVFYLQLHHPAQIFLHHVYYWRGMHNISSTSKQPLCLLKFLFHYGAHQYIIIATLVS